MIFASEVNDILNDIMPSILIAGAVEHYDLGGFHINVDASQRKAFKAWLSSDRPLPDQATMPTQPQQLDLIEGACND